MKTRFWIFVVLLVVGAVLAGYSSGRYEGVRNTRTETRRFLTELARATDLVTYLDQRGHKEWIGRLTIYGLEPTSDRRARTSSAYGALAGMACVAVGLVGLLSFSAKLASVPVRKDVPPLSLDVSRQ